MAQVSRPVRASATITRGAAAALSGEDAEETGEEVTGKVQALKWENARLEALVSELRMASPSVARLADLAVWREREAFEEKTRRALVLLRRKDAKIRALGEAAARRRLKVDARSAAGEECSGGGGGGSKEDGGGGGGGGAGGDGGGDENSVVARLERCLQEREGQIDILLEEVKRLRSGGNARSIAAGANDRSTTPTGMNGSTAAQPPTAGADFFVQSDSPREPLEPPRAGDVCARQGVQVEWRESAAAVDDLRTKVARLESELSSQAIVLAQKDSALRRASACHHRELEDSQKRETRLEERVETLERLQETARRTVLDREERLRELEEGVSTPSTQTPANENPHETGTEPGGGSRESETEPAACSINSRTGERESKICRDDSAEGRLVVTARSNEKGLEDFIGAQEWWLHLAAAVKRRGGHLKSWEGEDATSHNGGGHGGVEGKSEIRGLRRLLGEQGLEVVALRQRLLKADVDARAKAREGEQRAMENNRRRVKAECSLKTQKLANNARVAELEKQMAALSVQGTVGAALAAAREEISALKLAVIRAEGDARLHAQLLEDERKRSIAALSRAEDLQGEMDKLAVGETLRGVSGNVSASTLIDHFAGTLIRQSHRVEGLEAKVRGMRTRCARLARLAGGDPAAVFPDTVPRGMDGTVMEGEKCEEKNDEWAEAGVQEAAAAMAAGRRRALEEEVESLRKDVLKERRRADAGQRDAVNKLRRRSLANAGNGTHHDADAAALRRKLVLASSEIEALRTNTKDLRRQIQSGYWMWQARDTGTDERGDGGSGGAGGGKAGFSDGSSDAREVTSMLREVRITAVDCGEGGGGGDASASVEVARLSSLLAEKSAQVSVLTSTVEALQSSTSFVLSPAKDGDGGIGGNANPHVETVRTRNGENGVFSKSQTDSAADVDGGVGILNHIGAQGLARHCVALAVRLTSATAREGAAERRADRLAAEMEGRERNIRAAAVVEADLSRRNRALEKDIRMTAEALHGVRAESSARLQDAAEEASQLRSALRAAELGADDAQQKLASARAEVQALAAELQTSRERYRDDVARLSKEHDSSIKECADRLFVGEPPLQSRGPVLGGGRGAERKTTLVSPVASAIAELAEQWRSWVATEDGKLRHRRRSASRHRPEDKTDGGLGDGGSDEQQLFVTTFLRETATRLDAECFRAVRHARALEWDLRGARQEALDATMALEEVQTEAARLSARTEVAEAVVTAASFTITPPARKYSALPAEPAASSLPDSSGDVLRFGFSGVDSGGGGGWACRGKYTVAAVSLLEKRLAAALEDLVSSKAATSAAKAGEAAAIAWAEAAEIKATSAQAAADVLSDELERHKSSVSNRMVAEATEWRREVRSELGRWWQDDLMSLHNGVALDWGSAGAADEAAAVWTTRSGVTPAAPPFFRGVNSFSGDLCAKEDPVNEGISGKGAMAQALIAGRVEQAILEDRVKVGDHRLAQVRGEALHLRAILERWHGDFVVPAMQKRCRRSEDADARKEAVEGKDLLERKLLSVTADLLGVREEAAGLRGEIVALQVLVARLREDENEAREAAGRRIESARETVRRRAEGDLRDAAERLVEERQTFKMQLGAAHADILRLEADTAKLERQNREMALGRAEDGLLDWRNRPEGTRGGKGGAEPSAGGMIGENSHESAGVRQCLGDVEGLSGGDERERVLREVEEEREALRRMCNGLAVDLKAAVEARAGAEDDREALVQEAAKADAQAKIAGLARENQETALKDLGRLLAVAREAATEDGMDQTGNGDRPLDAAALSSWDPPKEEAQRFARFMVAAKVMQADLLRRLQEAGASEADLRHMLRRRDIRIEELKREQAMADRLATSTSGMPRSTLVDSCAGTTNARQAAYTVGAIDGGFAVADTDKAGSAAERAVKEVALVAAVKRLELELAEAAARGDVGDAAVRKAERLALKLFPETTVGHGGGGRRGCCQMCGRLLNTERCDMSLAGSQARGLSFLVPSTVVERKAAAAEKEENGLQSVDAAVQTMRIPSAVCNSAIGCDTKFDHAAVESGDGKLATRGSAVEAHGDYGHGRPPTSVQTEHGRKAEHGHNVPVVSHGLNTGLRSIEAHLARLEAVASCGFANGTNVDDSRVRSTSPGGKSEAMEWALAQVVHDLRTQVSGLRDQAEETAELLNAERAGKDDLEEETLRLRAELLRQQRSYWQATATLNNRYERALHEASIRKQPPSTTTGSRQTMLAIENIENKELRGSGDPVAADEGGDVSTPQGTRDSTGATGSAGDGMKTTGLGELQVRLLEESLKDVRDQLRGRERELRDGRALHVKEAKEAKVELDRAMEAQQARVGTLEVQLRRVRKKLKVMARPKPTRVYGRRVAGGGGDGLAVQKSPLSIDELLNMLTAADEEVFEAKGRTQRLEHELRAKTAEVNALLESATTVSEDAGVGASENDSTERQSSTVGGFAALSPTAAACFGASALSVVACAARLACAEAEVGRLRDEGLAASEVAVVAQREASFLRVAAHRRMADRADKGRSRQKELRRQLSAYKREVNRLRLADVRVGALFGPGRARRPHEGNAAAEREDTEKVLSKTQAQLDAVREESERRGRTIVALRTTKMTLTEDLEQRRQEAAELEAKLTRALTDLGVKSNAVKALRRKNSTLEAEVKNAQKTEITPMTGPACTGACECAAVAMDSCDIARAGPTRADVEVMTLRELRAERDRLRANMRARQGLLSKQAAEIEAQAGELERLEEEAGTLRAAVGRKDHAYRITKKQLASVREEFESFKESSGRWQADAKAKWRHFKRASESATKDAKTCRQAGVAAEHELTTLKAAFRSFLKTLWDDMKHRPVNSATFRSDDTNCPADPETLSSATPLPLRAKPFPERRDTSAEGGLDPDPGRLRSSETGGDTAMSRAGASAPVPAGFVVVKAKGGERDFAGAVDAAGDGANTNGGPFEELTEAEVSDIMQALSGDSYSHPFSDRVAKPTVPPPDLLDSAPVTQLLPSFRSAAAMSPPLDREDEEAFSARVESALAGRNTSAALEDVLCSMHAQNVSETAAGTIGGGPPAQPQPPRFSQQSDSSTTWAEPRAVVAQAPGPCDTNVSREGWPRTQTLDHAAEVLLFSGDVRGDLQSRVAPNAVGNAPSCRALDGAAFTFGGHNADSLLVEDLS